MLRYIKFRVDVINHIQDKVKETFVQYLKRHEEKIHTH